MFLIAASLWLARSDSFTTSIMALTVIAVLVNVIATALVMLNWGSLIYRLAGVSFDVAYANLIFTWSGPTDANIGWLGLLPVISAGLNFRWVGIALVIPLTLAIQGWLALAAAPRNQVVIYLLAYFVLYMVAGSLSTLAGERLAKGERILPKVRMPKRRRAGKAGVGQSRAVFNLVTALSASLNYQKVLETSLDLSAETLEELNAQTDKLVSAVLLFTHSNGSMPELQVATSRRMLSSDNRVSLKGSSGLIGRSIDTGEANFTKYMKKDPELSRFVALQTCQSAYCFPLRTGLEAYGALLFAHPDPEFFSPDRREVLEIVGKQSMIALQNARLYRDLEQEKNRMMEIQEEARKKMARDLHDGPTQSVSAIAMRVNFARRLMERDLKSASEELFKIEELARRTTKEIRHMLFTLRPLVLESQGLIAALESMAEKMRETYNQNVIIQADQRVVDALEMSKQAVVFYIAEEAVNNARKHAQAPHIWVRLKMIKESLSLLEIEDDGIGFNIDDVDASYDHRGSLGMVNMRERTELVNGVLRIDSAEGKGTRVQVLIPLSDDAADDLRRNM
jgi:signal transduction histidine kinase